MSISKPAWPRYSLGNSLDGIARLSEEELHRNAAPAIFDRIQQPQHSGCERVKPRVQTSAEPAFRPLTLLERIGGAFRTWYGTQRSRERRCIEADARRLGGRVVWDDTQ